MAQTCDACKEITYRVRFIGGQWLGLDCRCVREAVAVDMDNPFRSDGELVLSHVHDEQGKPLRVTSRRQLEEAQSKLHFNHVPSNMDKANWDRPKQQKFYTVRDLVEKRFNEGRMTRG